MTRSRFTEPQIIPILKEADRAAPVKDICRELGVTSATF